MSLNTTTETLTSPIASDEVDSIHRKIAERCQIILETLYDSYNGYKQCAEDSKDIVMKSLFQRIAASRADLITKLSNVIQIELGVEPIKEGSTLAAAHRAWIDVKAWYTDGLDKEAIINEVHRGEQILIKFYEAALEDPSISPTIRDFLLEQLAKVTDQNLSIDTI